MVEAGRSKKRARLASALGKKLTNLAPEQLRNGARRANGATSYSFRSAIIGSTLVARRAGIQQASSATNVRNNVMAVNVSGSVVLMPNSRLFTTRVRASAIGSPSPTPISANVIPCFRTRRNTSFGCAPSASLSRVIKVKPGFFQPQPEAKAHCEGGFMHSLSPVAVQPADQF